MLTDLPEKLTSDMLVFQAKGRDRTVYDIAGHPDLLAKIPLSDDARMAKMLAQEARFLALRPDPDLPLARDLGARETELGPAQISQRISAPDGEIAPSLEALVVSGAFSDIHLNALNTFVATAITGHIAFSDFRFSNLAYGLRAGDDAPRVYAVDGFGDKSLIKLKLHARWANPLHITRKMARVPRGAPLYWDRSARSYRWRDKGAAVAEA
ncbi:MAG: YrbL family protein [Pseudomonadota bacterium]